MDEGVVDPNVHPWVAESWQRCRAMGLPNETLSRINGQSVDRSLLYGAQTPQIFHSELLKAAYSQAYDMAFTDDASVVERYGKSPSYIIGERLNMKITTAEDLLLAEAVLKLRNI